MKKQARLQSEDVFKNPADKVIDTLENISNTGSSQAISTEVQPDKQKAKSAGRNLPSGRLCAPSDFTRKLTFQIRDSIYQQLKDIHYILDKELGDDAPDREVIVEFAIAYLLDMLPSDEGLKSDIAHRQLIRKQDLESGALINPSSRKRN